MPLKTLLLILCALPTPTSFAPAYGQSARPADRLRPFRKDGKWGYIDGAGKMVIAPKYDSASKFSGGLARVGSDKRWGYINTEGGRVRRATK